VIKRENEKNGDWKRTGKKKIVETERRGETIVDLKKGNRIFNTKTKEGFKEGDGQQYHESEGNRKTQTTRVVRFIYFC
jgi:hypothetical protein